MAVRDSWLAAILLLVAGLSGCFTYGGQIETMAGPVEGEIHQPMQVLGVGRHKTDIPNQPDAKVQYTEDVTIRVPVGTNVIFPAVSGWTLGYGGRQPMGEGVTTWSREDHNWGIGYVAVQVVDINAPTSTTPPTQTATIRIYAFLNDDTRGQEWWGRVNYELLFLRRCPESSPCPH